MRRVLLLVVCAAFSVQAAFAGCTSDWDCQLNGLCVSGSCQCDPAWSGPTCGSLQLEPGAVAYGCLPESVAGPDSPPNCTVTSWGGGPPVKRSDGKYVLYVSEMAGHCGLSVWQRYSTIVAAVADTPYGPYVREELVIPAESHNAYFIEDPVTQLKLIYHIGIGTDGPNPPPEPKCTNGTTPASPSSSSSFSIADPEHFSPSISASPSFSGPFKQVNISGVPGGVPPRGASNPAPYIFPNGTTLMLFRDYAQDKTDPSKHTSRIFVTRAPKFSGPYEVISEILHPANAPTFNSSDSTHVNEEDPCIWRDTRGHFHALFHFTHGHAWSEDGLTWGWSQPRGPGGYPAFTASVRLDNGTVVTLKDAERPRVWLDENGQPALLFVASGGQHQPTKPVDAARGFTVVQRIKTK